MIPAARGKWTEKEILDVLHAKSGSRQIAFRFDVLRNGVRARSINATGSISLDRFANIQRTGRFTVYEALDWLKEEIKPYMLLRMNDIVTSATIIVQTCQERDDLDYTCAEWDALDWTCEEWDAGVLSSGARKVQYAEFPLGVFIPSTPDRVSENGTTVWNIEAYDRSLILKEDCTIEPLYIAAGTPYISAVESILQGAGIIQYAVQDYVDTVLPADREFDIGLSNLEIINILLSEINFNNIYCDADGRFIISAYKEPSGITVTGEYKADALSIIERDTQSELDYFGMPNVFIAICSNPDIDEDYVSIWTNNSPASPFSTVHRGRNITSEIYKPDAIASQSDLDNYIRRKAFEVMNSKYEKLTFATALNPLHESGEVLSIKHPDITGIYVESSWAMDLSASGKMNHVGRRLVQL